MDNSLEVLYSKELERNKKLTEELDALNKKLNDLSSLFEIKDNNLPLCFVDTDIDNQLWCDLIDHGNYKCTINQVCYYEYNNILYFFYDL